ncbi:MAG TPA: BON domain-containing protein [Vicinamibacterales bacterium]
MHGRLLLGVLGTAALLVGCSQSDSGITSSVKSKLVADEVVKARNINVDTHDRVVTLTGTVQSPVEESRALEIARDTKGVDDVVDKMSVASGEPGATPTTGLTTPAPVNSAVADTTITNDVRARLLADSDVSSQKIDVNTHDRVVTLSGTVATLEQKSKAVELAGKAENVVRVEDDLLVPSTPAPPAR